MSDRRADELLRAYRAVAAALGVPAWRSELVEELAGTCGWGARSVDAPLLPSGVSHGVPWGVSIVADRGVADRGVADRGVADRGIADRGVPWGVADRGAASRSAAEGGAELRVFVEAQGTPASPRAYWEAAQRVTSLAAEHGADTARLEALLATGDPEAGARVWHAVSIAADRPPRWHAYLRVPPERAAARAALAAAELAEPPLRPQDRVTIVSLDLVAEAPRVKAYVLMPDVSPDELEEIAGHATRSVPGDARRFARAMLGGDRAIWWLAAFGSTPGAARPHTCALHFGVPRHVDELHARARITRLLDELGLAAEPWRRAADALGAHHFVTFQRRAGAPRVTAYFLPQVRRS